MKKTDAIRLFGSVNAMAEALDVTRQTIHGWNENLNLGQIDRIRGAYMRLESEPSEEAEKILEGSFVRKYSGKPVKR